MKRIKQLHIAEASPSWRLIMQSGIGIQATVGLPLSEFISLELGLAPEQQKLIDVLILDGMPVDEPAAAIVADGSRLAFASGLPGIAGLAMKKNSAVRALRGPITHAKKEKACPRPGQISLALYSLILPALGGQFLKKGVIICSAQLRRYSRFALNDICSFEGKTYSASDLAQKLFEQNFQEKLLLTAEISSEPDNEQK